MRCEGGRLLNDQCEVGGSGRSLLDALRLSCFVLAVVFVLADCSSDNAARVRCCAGSFFCDKGCPDSGDGSDSGG